MNFLYFVETAMYNLQQRITYILINVNSFQLSTCLLFFSAGILTVFNPCFISLFPLSISYINSYTKNIDKYIFIIGLVTSILVIIFLTNFFSYSFFTYITRIPLLSLIIIVFLSLNLLQVFNIFSYFNILNFYHIFNLNQNNWRVNTEVKSYFTGFIIGLTTVPCNTPIFTMIHFLLYNSNKLLVLFIYLIIYLAGCIFPFLLVFYIFFRYLQAYVLLSMSNVIIPFIGFTTLTISLFFLLEKIIL